jgi:protein TonB
MPSARTETQPPPLPAAPLDLTVASGPVAAPPVPVNAPPLPAPAPAAHTAHVVLPSPEAIVAAATNPSNVLAPLPGDGPAARTPTGSSPALAPVPGAGPAPTPGATTKKAAPPRLVIVGGAAAVLLVAVVGIFMATRGGGDTSATPEAEAPQEAPATPAAPPPAATVPDTPPPTVAVPPPAVPPPSAPVRTPSASRKPAAPPSSTARTGAAPAPVTPAAPAAGGGRTTGAFEIDKVDERPSVRTQVPPAYPADALQRRVEDVVVLRVLVNTAGTAGDVQILRGSKKDVAFDAAAITAVRQWTFTPAKKAGRTVDCWFNVGVPFQLRR